MNVYQKLEVLGSDPTHRPAWWRTVDQIQLSELLGPATTLTRSRNLPPREWLKLCGILNDLKTNFGLTAPQRRWLTIYCALHLTEILNIEEEDLRTHQQASPFM